MSRDLRAQGIERHNAGRAEAASAVALSAPEDVLRVLGEKLGRQFHAARVVFSKFDRFERTVSLLHQWSENGSDDIATADLKLLLCEELIEVLLSGSSVSVADLEHDGRLPDRHAAGVRLAINSFAHIPYTSDNQLEFILTLMRSEGGEWHPSDLALLRDASERTFLRFESIQAQAALSHAIRFDEAVLGNMGEGLYTTDRNGHLITMNAAAEKMLGFTADELRGRPVHDIIHHTSSDGARIPMTECRIFKVLESGKAVFDVDDEFIRRDGTTLDVRYTSSPLIDSGDVIGLVVVFRDVSERRRIERRIRESEARLRAMFVQAGVGVCLIGSDRIFEQVNPKFCEIVGYREDELLGQSFLKVADPAETSEHTRIIDEALGTEAETASLETRCIRKDGERVWVRINLTRIPDFDEKAYSLVAVVEDINERKIAENRLRESEQRFARFMQHLPGLAWIKDPEGRYLYANEAAQKAFGVSSDALYGKTDTEVFPPETAAVFIRNDMEAIASESGVQTVETLETGPGRIIESLVSKFTIIDDSGGNPMIGGIAIDVTEQRQNQRDQEFLFEISDRIRTATDPANLLAEIAQLAGKYLAVHRCLFNEIDLDSDTETVHSDFARDGESVAGVHKVSAYSPVMSEIMMSGKTAVNCDSRTDPRTAARFADVYEPAKELAYITVPMLREGKWVASLWCSDDKPREWTHREIALLENIAERTWSAVERLRAQQHLQANAERLRESEERFQLAQSAGNVGVWDWDIEAGLTYWSDTMWSFYGEEPSGINPDDEFWTAHLHPEDRDRVKEHLQRTVESADDHYRDEFRILGAEGRTIWIASMANLVRRPDGKAVRVYGVNLDITERKLNEERIKKSETQLRIITDSLPALIAYIDKDQRYQFVNGAYSAWFGIDPDSLIEMKILDVVGERAYRTVKSLVEKALAGEAVSVHTEVEYNNIGTRFIHLNYVPDIAEDGTVRGFFSLISDLTEMKRSEELLRSTEERMALLMENVSDYAIFSVDTEGVVESWNTGAERIFGYSAEEIIGQSCELFFTVEDIARGIHVNELRMARQKGRVIDERWYVRKGGARFFANVVTMPLIVGKRLTGYAKIASDLTERKRSAEALQSAHDELELRVFQRTKELGEMNELLRLEVEQRKLSEKQRVNLLHRIVSAQESERKRIARDIHDQFGQRLTALRLKLASLRDLYPDEDVISSRIDRLQEIAKLLDGEVSFLASELRPSILDDLGLEEALRAYTRDWSNHFDIKVKFHSNGLVGKRFGREAETQLYRIAQEALNNIAKHAGTTEVSVLMEQTADFLVLIIEDFGAGFDIDNSPPRTKQGLGLVGMKERASLIGAKLEIESEQGKGTTIFLRLPNRKRGKK